MHSLQKPRKVEIIGSDSKPYLFLCKPKDDLRKDSRMMEFNTVINKLLKKDPEGRRRQLCILQFCT
jgi:serine/threonine-protein kinase ATR